MLLFVLVTSLAQAPSTAPGPSALAVVLARRTGVAAPDATTLVSQASSELTATTLQVVSQAETAHRLARLGLKDAMQCKGKTSCLAELGQQLQVSWLVLVSVSALEGDRSLALELLDVAGEQVVEKDAVLLPSKTPLTPELLEGFVAHAAARIAAPLTPPIATLPTALTEPDLTPPPPPPTPGPAGRVEEPLRPTHTRGVVLLTTAGVLLAGAAVLLGFGLSMNAKLSAGEVGADGRVRSSLTASEATAVATTTSVELGTAGAATAMALGLATAAVLTW